MWCRTNLVFLKADLKTQIVSMLSYLDFATAIFDYISKIYNSRQKMACMNPNVSVAMVRQVSVSYKKEQK